MHSTIMPLRRLAGTPLQITKIEPIDWSGYLEGSQINSVLRTTNEEVEEDIIYQNFLPPAILRELGDAPLFGNEVPAFKMPTDLPFQGSGGFASIWIDGPQVEDIHLSRKLWAEFDIHFKHPEAKVSMDEKPTMGGILLGGYPYMPSYLNTVGEPSANHGIPREMRISWRAGVDQGFIDDEISLTRQLPAWHSNYQILETGPIVTNRITLRISDLPRRFGSLRSWNEESLLYTEYWAAIIPYIYIFEYEEKTQYTSHNPVGIVAATQTNRKRPQSHFSPALDSAASEKWAGAESALVFVSQKTRAYPFTPQSAVIPAVDRRKYTIDGQEVIERYISNVLGSDDKVHLFISQRGEHCRCVAGLRLKFGDPKIADLLQLGQYQPLQVHVYEQDSPSGTPLASVNPDLNNDKYSRLLIDKFFQNPWDDTDEGEVVLRFRRPSLSRYLCIILTAPQGGYVVLDELSLVQSAHVSVMPRASRTQVLNALHFRLIGSELGSDYAILGDRGFSLSVDRIVAGERRERLFHAHSLEELMRSGVAQLITNSRTRAAEKQSTYIESTQSDPPSFMVTTSKTKTDGWHRSETGDSVEGLDSWDTDSMLSPGDKGFITQENTESRIHVKHVAEPPEEYLDILTASESFPNLAAILAANATDLWKDGSGIWDPWLPKTQEQLEELLRVKGLHNISIPPYFKDFMFRVATHKQNPLNNDIDAIEKSLHEMVYKLFLINGAGISTSKGIGLVGNLGWSNNISTSGVANVLNSHSIGTTGSISHNARRTGYSYTQSLTGNASETKTRLSYDSGQHHQTLVRALPHENLRDDRIPGAEVAWNGQVTDLIIGTIPLGIVLPAVNDPVYRTTDNAIRVSFGRTDGQVQFDIWFDMDEEIVRDDY